MKLVCSGYSKNSNACNNTRPTMGRCRLATTECGSPSRLQFRCPRQPWLREGPKYVSHVPDEKFDLGVDVWIHHPVALEGLAERLKDKDANAV